MICDVAIVGYGPTGAVLANFLGRAGLGVAVLEREPSVLNLPRAAHFDGFGLARDAAALDRLSARLPVPEPVRV
jgi:2-polyprenyl-6-methoxyphenol hydroxylase-like FAD-dependent oxidoreductase